MESSIYSLLHPNCYHQIIYSNSNQKIYYLPPYEYEIWHYKKENVNLIQRAICEFNWKKAFDNKDIDYKLSILNNTVNNVLSKFILHETIACDHRNPPWFHNEIENLIKKKNIFLQIVLY